MDWLDRLEEAVVKGATSVVQTTVEFPAAAAAAPASQAALSKAARLPAALAASQARAAESGWEAFFEAQSTWRDALAALQRGEAQAQAQDPRAQLLELLAQVVALPDPLPALNAASALASKTAELEAANRGLQQQVASLSADQAEVSQLLADHQAEQEAHQAAQAANKALQAELAAAKAAAGGSEQLQQQAAEQACTIASLQASLASLRAEFEAAQSSLFELTSQHERAAGRDEQQAALAAEEAERAARELACLRQEREQWQRQLAALQQQQQQQPAAEQPGPGSGEAEKPGSSGGEHAAGAHVVALQAALEAAEEAARDQAHQVSLLTSKLAAAQQRLTRLQAELEQRPQACELAALSEQRAALSALLCQQLEAEGWPADEAAAAAAAAAAGGQGQLEPLLQQRCRRLEQALQASRAQAAAAAQAAAEGSAQAAQLQAQLADARSLVAQLEADLVTLSSSSSSSRSSSRAVGPGGLGTQGSRGSGGLLAADPLASLVPACPGMLAAGTDGEGASAPGTPAAAAAPRASLDSAAGESATSLLPVVAAQRDRFRARVAALEAAQAEAAAQLAEAQARAAGLAADNVALVEKIRFLERYKHTAQAGPGAGGGQGVTVIRVDGNGVIQDPAGAAAAAAAAKANRFRCGPLSLELGGGGSSGSSSSLIKAAGGGRRRPARAVAGCFGGDEAAEEGLSGPEGRYVTEYEAKLNPFAAFQAAEGERMLRALPVHDKALLAGGRLIAGSRAARAALAVYALLLHAFVMALMYSAASPHAVLAGAADTGVTGA